MTPSLPCNAFWDRQSLHSNFQFWLSICFQGDHSFQYIIYFTSQLNYWGGPYHWQVSKFQGPSRERHFVSFSSFPPILLLYYLGHWGVSLVHLFVAFVLLQFSVQIHSHTPKTDPATMKTSPSGLRFISWGQLALYPVLSFLFHLDGAFRGFLNKFTAVDL